MAEESEGLVASCGVVGGEDEAEEERGILRVERAELGEGKGKLGRRKKPRPIILQRKMEISPERGK